MAKKQSFIEKNLVYITIIVVFLFIFKTTQSCNRNMKNIKLTNDIEYLQDSLNIFHGSEKTLLLEQLDIADDSIKELNYELRLAKDRVDAANRRANAIQSTAEKIKDNTNITIENKSEKDTVVVKNEEK